MKEEVGLSKAALYLLRSMIKTFVSRIIVKNKNLLLHEAENINGFMGLLMKTKNTRDRWTREEKKMLRAHLWHLSCYIPALIIFALPFGSLLFPLLAEIMDRRKNRQNRKLNTIVSTDNSPVRGS